MDNNTSEKLEIPPLVLSATEVNLSEDSSSVPLVTEKFKCCEEVETSKNQNTALNRVWDKTDNCLFCKNNVTNFTRHLVRKHKSEIEVKKFVALPKGSSERKLLAELLRKRGNFLYHVEKGNNIRSVRRPNKKSKKTSTVSDYLPCKYCLGMFKRKFLHRHLKICKNNNNKTEGKTRGAQADGQNLMLDLSDIDKELVEKVFSRMACDNISFVAKSDKLITSFGTKCLKSYKDKRLISSVSHKMRTLARFLIAMRNEVSTIHSLQDCLSPNNFDTIVKCAKIIGRYNEKKDSCKPSFAFINLGNLLKQCCDVAAELITLKKSDDLLLSKLKKDQKSIKMLIKKNWSNQFTSNDINRTDKIYSNNSEVECSITRLSPNTGKSINKKNGNNSKKVPLKCIDLHQVYGTNTEFPKSKNENNTEVFCKNTKQPGSISDTAADNNNLLLKVGVVNYTEIENSNDCITASSSTVIQTPREGLQYQTSKAYNITSEQLLCSRVPKINASENNSSVCIESENSDLEDEVGTNSKKKTPSKTVRDKFHYCLFCEKNVTNFARHIVRNHKNEKEVAKYIALPKGSTERKFEADLLRKKGNFLNHVQNGNKMKLVRRPKEFETKSISVGDYLPCKFCLGMFKKKLLHRHLKNCKNNKNEGRNRAQADGQNLMLNLTDIDKELVSNVFPRMTGDNISFVAKSDKLITSFGVKYLKSHNDKKLIASVSQKMRTLARFLIVMRNEVSSVHFLQDCLNPKYFDPIIKCTKKIGQYNEKTDIYESPSIVVKLGLLLKNCCDIAIELISSKENDSLSLDKFADKIEPIKNIKYMIDVNWAYQFMTLNKKYTDVVGKSTNESCLAACNNVLSEIDCKSGKNVVTDPMEYFGNQSCCKTVLDGTSQKLNFEVNTEIFHTKLDELCPIICNSELPNADLNNEENEKNNASMTVSSLQETQISTKDSQNTYSILCDERDNVEMDTEYENSSDNLIEDSRDECLPCVDDISINDLKHHKKDSIISEKCENSQFLLNKSSTNLLENNLSEPVESDNSNLDEEIQTRSKTVKRSKKMKDKLNFCLFCEKNITNFTRHLVRKHKNEIEVVKYESLPKNSIERKLQADLLRKRGNFVCHVEKGKEIKVVRRSKKLKEKTSSVCDYLPCKYCFGMFRKKYLHRHLKVCKNIKNKTEGRNKAQADGQNMMLKLTNMDENLVANVFPRMACDDISFVAKSDKLITNYASSYLKCNKEKYSIAALSQKMRILGRFVIAMKSEVSTIRSLQDCLTPEHFDTIIKCSKKMAQFNYKTNRFDSLSTVRKLEQLLKSCCDVALSSSLNESANELNSNEKNRESFKNIKYMIENHWLYKFSTNNSEQLNLDARYNPTLHSLTSDIILLRENIMSFEKESHSHLKSNPNNIVAYQNLQESILIQIVLLNRCQSDEDIQHMSLKMFNSSLSDISLEKNLQALSLVEQNISKYFKHINIENKHGEIVPIQLTPQLFTLVQYLLKLRSTANFISHENPYLFPLMHSTNSTMRVSDIISKFDKKYEAKHLENISTTRFKKYVAIITQLLYLTKEDIENLTTSIGYNKDIHKESDRVTDNAFQVAKLSKYLLMRKKSEEHAYQENSLDDININVDDYISDEDHQCVNYEETYILDQAFLAPNSSNKQKSLVERQSSLLNQISCKRQLKKKRNAIWSTEDKAIITKYFEMHIISGTAPRKQECEELSKLYPQINKPWKKIKDLIHNTINAQKRNNDKFCVL